MKTGKNISTNKLLEKDRRREIENRGKEKKSKKCMKNSKKGIARRGGKPTKNYCESNTNQ